MIKVSKHIKGKEYILTENTDTFGLNVDYGELLCFEHNFKPTIFDYQTNSIKQNAYLSGVLDFGIYTYNCQAQLLANNPSIVDTYISAVTTTRNGKVPSVMSYALGTIDYFDKKVLQTRFLGGRNSSTGNNFLGKFAFRGQEYLDMICRDSTFRWNYYTTMTAGNNIDGNETQGLAKLTSHINTVKANNGWFVNFMHWHWWITENTEIYFNSLSSQIDGNGLSVSYSDAVEWYWVRNSIIELKKLTDINFKIIFAKTHPINYDLITVPLYVDVSTVGTALQGLPIKTIANHKIYKRGIDKYTIAVPLDYSLNSVDLELLEDTAENYVNEAVPVVSIVGTTFTSNQAVKTVVFRKTKSGTKSTVTLLERQNTFTTTKTLPAFNLTSYDYYVCFINENGTSGMQLVS